MGLGLWITKDVWGEGPPAGEDVMGHLVRAEYALERLVAAGQIDGWFPRFMLGYQMFLFNGPGFTWLLALLRGATMGALSIEGAFKVAAVGSFALLPIAVAFVARSLNLSHRAAGVAAILSLAASAPFGIGLQGVFGTGLVPHQVGALFFLIALGAAVRVVTGRSLVWRMVTALSFALLLITHVRSAVVLAVLLPFVLGPFVLVSRPRVRCVARVVGAMTVGTLLAAFWLLPALAHRDLTGLLTSWGIPSLGERVVDILTGQLLFSRPIAVVTAFGLAAMFVFSLARWRQGLAITMAPVAYLAIAHASQGWASLEELTIQLPDRGLGYAGILMLLSLSAIVAALSHPFRRAADVVAIATSFVLTLTALAEMPEPTSFPEPVPQLAAAAGRLRTVVPPVGRFAVERDFPDEIAALGVIHPETWLARASGRNVLNVFGPEMSATAAGFEADALGARPVDESADALARYGVGHVVTTTSTLRAELERSERFSLIWRQPPVAIFALSPRPGQPDPSSLLASSTGDFSARMIDGNPEHLRIAYAADDRLRTTVALAWSPKWHATVDGRVVELGRSGDALLTALLPPGAHELSLDFRTDRWDTIGRAVTVATLIGLLLVLWRPRGMIVLRGRRHRRGG